jgi:putative transposase
VPCHEGSSKRFLRLAASAVVRAYDREQQAFALIKQCCIQSSTICGFRKISDDLQDMGERCGEQRVHRLMKANGLRFQTWYRRKPRHLSGRAASVASNHLARQFDVQTPNEAWVTDITYIRTHEGWLYPAVVLDLFSQQVVG